MTQESRSNNILEAVSDEAFLLPVKSIEVFIKIFRKFGTLHDKVPILYRVCLSGPFFIIFFINLYFTVTLSQVKGGIRVESGGNQFLKLHFSPLFQLLSLFL